MTTKIQAWGNSQGLRIPRELLEAVQMSIGDEVEISTEGNAIVIRGARKIRGRYKLEDLLAQLPEDYQGEELDWGKPQGKEVW
jgi:antitoxin MazE